MLNSTLWGFFSFIFIWRIIILQCCICFCCTTARISYKHTDVRHTLEHHDLYFWSLSIPPRQGRSDRFQEGSRGREHHGFLCLFFTPLPLKHTRTSGACLSPLAQLSLALRRPQEPLNSQPEPSILCSAVLFLCQQL